MSMESKVKFAKGMKVFAAVAEDRKQKQRAKDRQKAIGAKPGDKDFTEKAKQYAKAKPAKASPEDAGLSAKVELALLRKDFAKLRAEVDYLKQSWEDRKPTGNGRSPKSASPPHAFTMARPATRAVRTLRAR